MKDDVITLEDTEDIVVEQQENVLIVTLKKDLKKGDTIKVELP